MTRTPRDRQRGSAMLVTLILVAALLAGVAVLVSMQLTTTKSTELTRSGLASLHCAEAGLATVHWEVGKAANRPAVLAHLAGPTTTYSTSGTGWQVTPTFLSTFLNATTPHRSDLDGDGTDDYEVWIIDNDDDPGAAQDYSTDVDQRVWLIARCTKYPDTPKEVRELVEFDPLPTRYEWQEGRAFGNNNANPYN